MQEEHSLTDLCAALGVSRSGYHASAAREPGPHAQADAALWPLIKQTCGQPKTGPVHHPDRGVQYASAAAGVQPSMSRKGSCHDKALVKAAGAACSGNWGSAASSPPARKPGPPSSSGSNSLTAGSGSSAPSVTSHLWTSKHNSTKQPLSRCTHPPPVR
jgi:hypothetical protein